MTDIKYFLEMFRSSIMWLEKYIEIANYYSDWQQRKQTDTSPILWVNSQTPKDKLLHNVGTQLMLSFEGELDNEPLEVREDLKHEFYKWLDTSKIDTDAAVELKCALFDFHEILECRFEKAQKDRASRKREYEIDSPEYLEKMEEMFYKSQQAIHSGKVNEMNASRFNGNAEVGKTTLVAIANSLSAADKEKFSFWPQKSNDEDKEDKKRQPIQVKPPSQNIQNIENKGLSTNIKIVIGIGILVVVGGGIAIFLSKNKVSAKNSQ